MPKHGPVDGSNNILHSSCSLTQVEVNVFENDGKDVLLITVGCVKFVSAKFRVDILICDDSNQCFALLQTSACKKGEFDDYNNYALSAYQLRHASQSQRVCRPYPATR